MATANVNNAGLRIFVKSAPQMSCEEGNAFNMFVGPQGYTQYVLVTNTECKYRRVCLRENSTGYI